MIEAIGRSHRRAVAVLISVLLVGSCRETTGPDDELARARALWAAHRPANYSYTVMRYCECGNNGVRVRITVQNHVVTSRLYVSSGQPVEPLMEQAYRPIEGLFDEIEMFLERGWRVLVEYDPALGYPTESDFDDRGRTPDGLLTQYVTDFRPE
jgi:hypothetical protein